MPKLRSCHKFQVAFIVLRARAMLYVRVQSPLPSRFIFLPSFYGCEKITEIRPCDKGKKKTKKFYLLYNILHGRRGEEGLAKLNSTNVFFFFFYSTPSSPPLWPEQQKNVRLAKIFFEFREKNPKKSSTIRVERIILFFFLWGGGEEIFDKFGENRYRPPPPRPPNREKRN